MLFQLVAASMLGSTLLAPLPAPSAVTRPSAAPDPVSWKIDVNHSELTFEIRHLVSRVRGTFKQWSGNVVADPTNWGTGQVDVTIQTSSIDTNNDRRDADLRSSNFFAADSFPTIIFRSSAVEAKGSDIRIAGTLTMRGVSKPVVLTGQLIGMTQGANGKRRAGFEASTTVNRLDYGITWNRAAEGGGVVLGDEVKIQVVIAMVEQ
ncbi:MAG TPA: YceI family protein [Gemmatimonadaceae bacterium]|nr:YceI family protein [Gemmatimonadaceae bacterium]